MSVLSRLLTRQGDTPRSRTISAKLVLVMCACRTTCTSNSTPFWVAEYTCVCCRCFGTNDTAHLRRGDQGVPIISAAPVPAALQACTPSRLAQLHRSILNATPPSHAQLGQVAAHLQPLSPVQALHEGSRRGHPVQGHVSAWSRSKSAGASAGVSAEQCALLTERHRADLVQQICSRPGLDAYSEDPWVPASPDFLPRDGYAISPSAMSGHWFLCPKT